jgi:hypothetical protein
MLEMYCRCDIRNCGGFLILGIGEVELESETYARQLRLITPTIRPVGCFSDVRLVRGCTAFFSLAMISSFSSPSSPESSASSSLRVAE